MTDHKKYFCRDCIAMLLGRPMSEIEMMQHIKIHPTHILLPEDGFNEDENDFKNMVEN